MQPYKKNGILFKILANFSFAEIDKMILKFLWKCKGPKMAKTIFRRRRKLEDS